MTPSPPYEPGRGWGCAWLILLVGGPLALMAAITVFVQADGTQGRAWALGLLAVALAAALGSVWVRRAGMVRAADVPRDPAERMRKTFGERRLRASLAAPDVLGGSLAPALAQVSDKSALGTVCGVAGGDGRLPRGVSVGWSENGAVLPRLDLYSEGFDAELARVISGELVRVEHPDLIDPWLVGAQQRESVSRVMGDPLVAAMNTFGGIAIGVVFDGWGVTAFSDSPNDVDATRAIGVAVTMRSALPDALYRQKDGSAARDASLAGMSAKAHRRTASLGVLASEGRVKAQWQGLAMAGVFLAIFSAGGLVALATERGADAGTGAVATLLVGLLAGGVLTGVAIAATLRLDRRQRAVAEDVRQASRELSARYRSRLPSAESGWSRRPFGDIVRLVASPGATGVLDGRPFGMAFLSGDAGVGGLRARTFTSRVVWVEVAEPLPPVTFVREGLSERMLAILGGADLDVESAAFNAAWSVRAADPRAAHAMLQPTLIELLVQLSEPGIAFHIDGTRVALWDDATVGEADLIARARLVSEFASRIPPFVAQDWNARGAN